MLFGTDLVGTAAEANIDFGSTAQFSLIVPDGITVSSASGVFLSAVPEPRAWWLMVVGLICLVAGPRNRGVAELARAD